MFLLKKRTCPYRATLIYEKIIDKYFRDEFKNDVEEVLNKIDNENESWWR